MTTLTQERLKALLHYDPETGIFTNRIDRNYNARAGSIAGNLNKTIGYWEINLDGGRYRHHGEFAKFE